MQQIIRLIKTRIFGNELHANSLYLLLAQGTITLFGYLFWIIIARTYDAHNIGIASAIISVATLIANLSILGLNNTLVRFLSKSKRKSELINGALVVVGSASLLCALIYLAAITFFSPDLIFIRQNIWLASLFVISMVLVTINTLTDSVFIALRSTKYNLHVYLGYSVIRIVAPLALIAFGAIGIFLSHMAGVTIAVVLSFYFMVKKLDYNLLAIPQKKDINQAKSYSLINYAAGFAWSMPVIVAPILIINGLAAAQAAYFYMVMMIINVLLIIPMTFTQSLFAEGSHNTNHSLRRLIFRSVKSAGIIIIISALGVLLLGAFALSVFGPVYVTNGLPLLYLMVASIPLVHLNMTANVILKIQKRLRPLFIINVIGSLLTVGAMVVLLRFGLSGVGLGYLAGQGIMAMINIALFMPYILNKRLKSTARPIADLA